MALLTDIGLTENESKVYMALLVKGALPVNRVYEETGVHRRNIYDILNRLISKGLATFVIENKRKVFQATNPKKIITFLEEEKRQIEEKEDIVRKNLPELEKKFAAKASSIEAEIYRGDEGIKSLVDETLYYKETLFIGSRAYIMQRYPHYWVSYNRKRIKLGVSWKGVSVHEMRGHPITKEKNMQYKFLPKELTGPPNVIWIFGNIVANIVWTDVPIAFVIKDDNVAESYKKYFYFLWNKVAKK